MDRHFAAVSAQARLHHQYFLGLQLMVAVEHGREVIGDWMFRLFRRQHEEKFLASFDKLGLAGLPHAIACARYHVLSNGVGGVRVEYMEESDTKAWVRFRYPRWMVDGPVICGIPVEASRGFLNGWYAQNGVSLNNPRLGFVCVSEDMTGQFGLCGYFQEFDHDLTATQRLQFAPDELPPIFDPAKQPRPPDQHWNRERLAKAARNYAMDYCRNGLRELAAVVGRESATALGRRAARLTGLQQYKTMADAIDAIDGDISDAAGFLEKMFAGMDDPTRVELSPDGLSATIHQSGLRIARGIDSPDRESLMSCWVELWRGAISAQRMLIHTEVQISNDALIWRLTPLTSQHRREAV